MIYAVKDQLRIGEYLIQYAFEKSNAGGKNF